MTILSFPAIRRPTTMDWKLMGLTQTQASPFDGSTQTLAQPGARWSFAATWTNLLPTDWRVLDAFLASLNGRSGRFTASPWHAPRRGVGTGTPVVNGAGQTGSLLHTRGWTHAVALVLAAGDYISWPDATGRAQLHKVTGDTVSASDGQAYVAISPPIRRSPNDGAAIEIDAPIGVFFMDADDGAGVSASGADGGKASVSLQVTEALV